MDPDWMRSINLALSICPRLCRYAKAVLGYMSAARSRSAPSNETEDVKKMQAFLDATVAVLKKIKACDASQELVDKALADSVMLVQLQLEAMQLKQQLTVDALKARRCSDPIMPVAATAILAVARAPVTDSPGSSHTAARATVDEAGEIVATISAATAVYSGAERRKRC